MFQFIRLAVFVLIFLLVYPLASDRFETLPELKSPLTVSIPLSGTGSMYPTIPKSSKVTDQERAEETVTHLNMYRFTAKPSTFSKFFYTSKINRGDIVSFTNSIVKKIEEEKYGKSGGFVKRAIGLPGELIEIKSGIVYIDNIALREAYTALPHSTFGGDFLPDCQPIKIPDGKIFVMGDNRKQSSDSRHEIGLIDFEDIDYILPWEKQLGILDKNFRDTSLDLDPSTKIKTDKQVYLDLLNTKRSEKNLPKLKMNFNLEKSAVLRAETMLKTNDFSFTATRSGQDQKATMNKAGYWNPYYGETWRLGFYTAEELIENQFAFKESEKFVLDPKFDDIGIGITEGNLNNCPAQIIVTHYAGYIPPNYSKEIIDSWTKTLETLRSVSDSWTNLKDYPEYYAKNKTDVDEINQIIELRLNRLPPLVDKLQKNLWLTSLEEKLLNEDISLSKQQNSIADRLNSH